MGAFTLSAGAAGAAQSLQDLLKQRMLERQMMLAEWQAQQEAEYRKQQLGETTKLREAQQDWQRTYQTELLGDKQQAAQDRQQAGHLRKIDLMPIGATVGKTDPTLQEAETFGTRQLFQGQPVSEAGRVGQIGAGPTQAAGPDTLASQPITNEPEEQQFQFQGTAPQQQAAANARALQEERDANRGLREESLAALNVFRGESNADRDAMRALMAGRQQDLGTPGWSVQTITTPQGFRVVRVNARTGEVQPVDLGGLPATADIRNQARRMGGIFEIVNDIEGLSKRINTGQGLQQFGAGHVRKLAGAVNLDDTAREYQQLVEGYKAQLARLAGEVGVLTEQDATRAAYMVPLMTDSQKVAQDKIVRLRKFLQSRMVGAPQGVTPKRKRYDMDGNPIQE